MKKVTLTFLLLISLFCFSQKDKKETVYLLLDLQSSEKYLIEDGSGNSKYVNKYRKEFQDDYIYFKICDETFGFNKTTNLKDTCPIKILDKLKIVDLEYIINKKSKNILRYNPFEKTYILEKISKNKIIKYEVVWIDKWLMIED